MKKHKKKDKAGRRNAAPASAAPRARVYKRAKPPGWKDAAASIIGGAGSAFLSGLAVNQNIVRPATGAAVLIAAGGAAALLTDGTSRVVGNSMASAGAGQLALALMQRQAVKAEKPAAEKPQAEKPPAERPPALPPAPAEAPTGATLKNARRGGYVTAMFRDAASELEEYEDEEQRMGVRDADNGDADVFEWDDIAS